MLKKFKNDDIVTALSPFKEPVQVTSSIFSGGAYYKDSVLNPTNGWTSGSVSGSVYSILYDRPTTSIYKNKICSIVYGYSTGSLMYSGSFVGQQREQKLKMYKVFADRLLGDKDSIFKINNQEKHELIFISMYRNLYKDEISDDGQILLEFIRTGSTGAGNAEISQLTSQGNTLDYYGGKTVTLGENISGTAAGLCFLQSGIFVIDPLTAITTSSGDFNYWSGTLGYEELAKGVSGSTLNDLLYGVRQRIHNIFFYSKSKIRETFFRCSADQDEFNYSSNPSFVNNKGKVITNSGSSENVSPKTFFTTVGLYNDNYELIAVGKIPRPIKKDFRTKAEVIVRLTY